MAITASQLRQDLLQVLDSVIETGEPIEIERNGRVLRISAVDEPRARLDCLIRRPEAVVGDPEDLVHHDWSWVWGPE